MKSGATCIKLMASGGEAHKPGRKVVAHAYSVEAINNALSAGVDSVEHGSFLDRETAERMREQGAFLVPTMSVYAAMDEKGPELAAPEYVRRKTAEILRASRAAFRLALETGIPVAAGTDCGAPGHPHGTLPRRVGTDGRGRRDAATGPALRHLRGGPVAGSGRRARLPRAGQEGRPAGCDRRSATGHPRSGEVRLVLRDGAEVMKKLSRDS